MASFLRRFARATPIPFAAQSHTNLRLPFTAIAAISAGVSFLYCHSSPDLVHSQQTEQEQSKNIALVPDKWVEFKLQDTARVSHNTQLFRFSFDPTHKLGLDIASCILTRAPLGQDAEGKSKFVIRPYTPISDPESKGYFDLLIKVYPEGKMSQHFASLKPGDVVEVKGPIEKLRYTPNMKKHIGMIAGGTGITPMLQIIEAILKNPDDKTQISLLYANVSPDDILLKQKLDVLATSHPNLKIFYTVDNPTKNWRGGAGYISKDMVVKGLPGPSDDTLILVCGPPGMVKQISGEKAKDWTQGELSGILKEAGYTEQMVYKF
ncbi:NADH-cytochrome b5 reductase-like protein [Cajanus cajan]|uniref:NADH-cytochrome b5 reductase n=1 Tax=Cajanus cajan TaxID=3821 RepID=A0A151S8K6_CAJCA|nr:NADH-cytochrome b5 reductase-like protein [Cajanus cajan]KYP51122.1 NADH-cytochrome b5 reductase-like protein [Cajanus cajan]